MEAVGRMRCLQSRAGRCLANKLLIKNEAPVSWRNLFTATFSFLTGLMVPVSGAPAFAAPDSGLA